MTRLGRLKLQQMANDKRRALGDRLVLLAALSAIEQLEEAVGLLRRCLHGTPESALETDVAIMQFLHDYDEAK